MAFMVSQDPKDYLSHYERMMRFLADSSNHRIMEEELTGRGVKCINFYDVLIDFILLDSFDEIDKPPSSIKAILQNRWISASFRETVSNCIYLHVRILLELYGENIYQRVVYLNFNEALKIFYYVNF